MGNTDLLVMDEDKFIMLGRKMQTVSTMSTLTTEERGQDRQIQVD